MDTKFHISRLTGPQLDYALEHAGKATLAEVKKKLADADLAQPFLKDLREELKKNGLDPTKAPDAKLRGLITEALSAIQRDVYKGKLRSKIENVDLYVVARSFGTFAATLLQELGKIPVPGKMNLGGDIEHSEALALRIAKVYDELGPKAKRADVINVMKTEYPSFSEPVLESLRRRFPQLLPDLKAVQGVAERRAQQGEAEVAARIVAKLATPSVDAVVRAMKAKGYAGFSKNRFAILRKNFPSIVPSIMPTDATRRGKLEADAARVRAFVAKEPDASPADVARELGMGRSYVRTICDAFGIELATRVKNRSVLRLDDPVLKKIIHRALLDAGPFDDLTTVAKRLSASPVFREQYGPVSMDALSNYQRQSLRNELPDFGTLQRQKVTRLVVGEVLRAPVGQSLGETLKTIKREHGHMLSQPNLYERIGNAWRDHPALYPEAQALFDDGKLSWLGRGQSVPQGVDATPGQYDRAFANYVAWMAQGVADDAALVLAVQVFDPKFSDARLQTLREKFGTLDLSVHPESAPPRLDLEEEVAALLTKAPKTKLAAAAKALEVSAPTLAVIFRETRARLRTEKSLTKTDDEAILRLARQVEAGDTRQSLCARILADAYFKDRPLPLGEPEIWAAVQRLVPETRDWPRLLTAVHGHLLVDAARANPELSLSDVVRKVRHNHEGFPTYIAVRRSLLGALRQEPELLAEDRAFFAKDPRFAKTARPDTAATGAAASAPAAATTKPVHPETAARKRYAITENLAQTLGYLISTLPMGLSPAKAREAIEASGLLPRDMTVDAGLLERAHAKFPELVPTLREHDQTAFERVLAQAIFTAPRGQGLDDTLQALDKHLGGLPFSAAEISKEILPRWMAWAKDVSLKLPPWLEALLVAGEPSTLGLGHEAKAFPPDDLAKVQATLAEIAEIPREVPILEKLVARHKNAFAGHNIFCVQHLLGTNYRLIEAFDRMGAKREDILSVGIPYSTSKIVAETMQKEGFKTLTPPMNLAAWERQVEDGLYEIINKAKANGKPVLVFDDGGLVAKILHEKAWAKPYQSLFRIVEQTTRGITVASKYKLEVPVVNYARTDAKLRIEGPMIAENVRKALVTRLEAIGAHKLQGREVTVIGYGAIGEGVARELAKMGAKVKIYDIDPAKREQARADAKRRHLPYTIVDDEDAAFKDARMVIGNTGHESITERAFDLVAKDCIFGSTSSKLVEIDMERLDARATVSGRLRREVVDANNSPPTARYTLDNGRTITVLADGFPLNFDGKVDCIETKEIQITRGGMLVSGLMAMRKNIEPGIVKLDPKLHQELLDLWHEVRGRDGD